MRFAPLAGGDPLTRRGVGFFIGLTFLIAALAMICVSIRVKADDGIPQLRTIYENCVFRAVSSQLANRRTMVDSSAMTELAFQVCQSEERAIIAQLYAAGVTPVTADKALRGFKLRLQKTIRKVFGGRE